MPNTLPRAWSTADQRQGGRWDGRWVESCPATCSRVSVPKGYGGAPCQRMGESKAEEMGFQLIKMQSRAANHDHLLPPQSHLLAHNWFVFWPLFLGSWIEHDLPRVLFLRHMRDGESNSWLVGSHYGNPTTEAQAHSLREVTSELWFWATKIWALMVGGWSQTDILPN